MKRVALQIFLSALIAGWLAGCDTMSGFGRDLSKLGKKIEKKAEREKK